MFELAIKSHICSSHFLRGYPGKCKNLHGHTWKIEVVVQGDQLNDIGIVVDFKELKEKLGRFLEHLDHANLNDLEYFQDVNPSSEHLAKYIYERFSKECAPLSLKHVQVWESDNASVTYYPS